MLHDRCPHSHLFTATFGGCATYQPVTFVTTDSLRQPLASTVTCRHLAVGEHGGHNGRYYPRCALGAPVERLRWLAGVTPERVEVTRLLQEEFESMCGPHRDRLLGIKARMLPMASTPALRAELDAAARQFLEACERFLDERAARFEDAGLPVHPIAELIHDRVWALTRSSSMSGCNADDRIGRLPPIAKAFLGSFASPLPAAPANVGDVELVGRPVPEHPGPDDPVCEPGALRITPTAEPRGIALDGDIDLCTVHRVEEHLALLSARPGDLRVDFSGVVFCDIVGLRAIVDAGERMLDGSRLVVAGMPRRLRAMMRLAGWAACPGVVFAEPPSVVGVDAPDGLTA